MSKNEMFINGIVRLYIIQVSVDGESEKQFTIDFRIYLAIDNRESCSSRFSIISEPIASEILETFEEVFPRYWKHIASESSINNCMEVSNNS